MQIISSTKIPSLSVLSTAESEVLIALVGLFYLAATRSWTGYTNGKLHAVLCAGNEQPVRIAIIHRGMGERLSTEEKAVYAALPGLYKCTFSQMRGQTETSW